MNTQSEKQYRVHVPGSGATRSITGTDLKQAIEMNFPVVARIAGDLGSAAGYVLDKVTATYIPGILGGRGGVEVAILSHGMDLAHKAVDKMPRRSTVWIYADPSDLPEPIEFKLVAKEVK